ncbi:MAG TPA: sigma-70 family RNA polymerase sigma factor [Thermoanaerobaculia bacterium]|jgi:RNA polymerase sigma-70 factor (ECF subfamily)|nr:sigma-70 family RNA polymerase sigma factor [Thermoanaerobaculia bacterium]
MWLTRIVEDVVRNDGARVLAGLIRLAGDFDVAEDALQEAYARALVAWSRDGIPDKPAAWLNTVSRRIVLDRLRRDRRSAELPEELPLPPEEIAIEDESGIDDDRLRLLFTCCHPALSPEARRGLALRTLGGLSTREIARAFVEPEPTTAQRLVRAKKKIREARIPYEVPSHEKLPERVATVLSVLYLIFNEGYASTDAPSLLRLDLVAEAIRLARLTVELLPREAEAKGLLALILLTDSRRAARVASDGAMVPLEEQDRSLWNRAQIDEGVRMIDGVLALRTPGPYQIQAAIAALHAQAAAPAETDWRQIAALYETLLRWTPTPVVELNAAVADGMATSPERALERIARIEAGGALSRYHLLPASKADLLRRLGRYEEAAASYRDALALATNPAERLYLERRLQSLSRA